MSSVNDYETLDVLGLRIDFLSSLEIDEGEFTLIAETADPGVIIPLHSHPDRQLFSITEGVLEVFVADQWLALGAGDSMDIRDGIPHALRNTSGIPVRLLIVTTVRLGRFLRETGRPTAATVVPPSRSDVDRLLSTSTRYGYWFGSPEDNAAISLSLPMTGCTS